MGTFLRGFWGLLVGACLAGAETKPTIKFQRHRLDLLEGDYVACGVARIGGSQGLDFVVGGGRGIKQLLWYEYPQWKKYVIAEGISDYGVGCAVADVDSDGHPDVIISEQKPQPGLVWYRSPKDPRTGQWERFIIKPGDWVHDIVWTEMTQPDGRRARGIVTEWKRRVITWFAIPSDPTKPWPEVVLNNMGAMYEGTAIGNLAGRGRPDIVCAGSWYEAPTNAQCGEWKRHRISSFRNLCRAGVGDFNGDGRLDIVLVESEYVDGHLAWYEAPNDPVGQQWKEHRLNHGDLYFAHTLGVADFDGDGRPDILVGEMGQGGYHAAPPSHPPRLMVYRNDGNGCFTPYVINHGEGIHEGIVADINGDGRPDVIGKNALYRQEDPPHKINPTNVDWWENLCAAR